MYAREILYAIELVFWLPALCVAIYVTNKHGWGKSLGWISLVILSIFRLIGATTGIVAIYEPSTGVIEASVIANGVGLISLVVALRGLISRVNMNMYEHKIMTPLRSKILHLPVIAAIVLSITGAIGITGSHPSEAKLHFQIAIGLLTGVYLVVIFITLWTAHYKRFVLDREQTLLRASLISIPFISIRLLYSWLSAFLPDSYPFSMMAEDDTAVIIRALMQVLEECVVTGMFLGAGLTVAAPPKKAPKSASSGHDEGAVEAAFDKIVEAVHYRH